MLTLTFYSGNILGAPNLFVFVVIHDSFRITKHSFIIVVIYMFAIKKLKMLKYRSYIEEAIRYTAQILSRYLRQLRRFLRIHSLPAITVLKNNIF